MPVCWRPPPIEACWSRSTIGLRGLNLGTKKLTVAAVQITSSSSNIRFTR
jgi:hypothetical protein